MCIRDHRSLPKHISRSFSHFTLTKLVLALLLYVPVRGYWLMKYVCNLFLGLIMILVAKALVFPGIHLLVSILNVAVEDSYKRL